MTAKRRLTTATRRTNMKRLMEVMTAAARTAGTVAENGLSKKAVAKVGAAAETATTTTRTRRMTSRKKRRRPTRKRTRTTRVTARTRRTHMRIPLRTTARTTRLRTSQRLTTRTTKRVRNRINCLSSSSMTPTSMVAVSLLSSLTSFSDLISTYYQNYYVRN